MDSDSRTSMKQLYAIGETSCNGVHGANRLASNSLLESLVFARRAAAKMTEEYEPVSGEPEVELEAYKNSDELRDTYKKLVLDKIESVRRLRKERNKHE